MNKKSKLLLLTLVAALLLTGCSATKAFIDKVVDPGYLYGSDLPTFEEQVVYDQDGVVMTVMGLEERLLDGQYVPFSVENNTDKELEIVLDHCAINGIIIESIRFFNIAPGEQHTDEWCFYEKLAERNIDVLQEITFYVEIRDAETGDRLRLSDRISLKTSAYGTAPIVYDDTGVFTYENEYCCAVFQGVESDERNTYVNVFVQNKTDATIAVSLDIITVNDVTMDYTSVDDFVTVGRCFTILPPGVVDYDSITLTTEDMDLSGIRAVEKLEFHVLVEECENWDTLLEEGPLTVNF